MGEYVLPKVKAKYAYQRQNEDELTFGKGDIIQLITKDDGGWYEGKLNGKIGWFPSNYVREVKNSKKSESGDRTGSPTAAQKLKEEAVQNQETKQAFYEQVLQNFLETERAYVKEFKSLLMKYIRPMFVSGQSECLSKSEYKTLCGNLETIFEFHTKVLREIEENSKLPYLQQQVGQCFSKHSDNFDSLFNEYCGNHPCAVKVIQSNKDALSKYMEGKGSTAPGSVFLTSGLSKPFKRLEQYPNILRELARHIKENHTDRAYLSKSITTFEKILIVCQDTRKRKEAEQHILSSTIQNWEGEPLSTLGKVLYLSSAACLIGNDERKERHLLLFPTALLMLSASPRLSGFNYEGKIPLTALQAKKLDDCAAYQHAFEITGNLIERIVVITKSAEERRSWIKILGIQCEKYRRSSLAPVASMPAPSPIVKQAPVTQIPPAPKHATPLGSRASPGSLLQGATRPGASFSRQVEHISPAVSPPLFHDTNSKPDLSSSASEKTWCQMCLRPAAPCKHINIGNGRDHGTTVRHRERSRSPKTIRRNKKKNNKLERKASEADEPLQAVNERILFDKGRIEEEREILQVLDSYCTPTSIRNTVLSIAQGTSRHTSILEEKIIVEDPDNDTLIEEKSLVDTVYELRDQVSSLKQEQKKLQQNLEEETRARKRLESLIRRAAQGSENVPISSTRSSSAKRHQKKQPL